MSPLVVKDKTRPSTEEMCAAAPADDPSPNQARRADDQIREVHRSGDEMAARRSTEAEETEAHEEPGAALNADELADIMGAFTAVTERLQSAHTSLQCEVGRLKDELRDTNEQLHRSRRLAALGQMAAGIAHEIRNPLGSIRLYAVMLAEDLADSPEKLNLAAKINLAVGDLDRIVADVLAFAREMLVRGTIVDPSVLIDCALGGLTGLLHDTTIRIVRDDRDREDRTGTMLEVDTGLMNQVLTNVLRNAIEALDGCGTIRIDARPLGRRSNEARNDRLSSTDPAATASSLNEVLIVIQDNGPGIEKDLLERIFDPFVTTRDQGTGLGLAIVHRIVDAHGGRIDIRNNHPNPGATVRIALPAFSVADRDANADAQCSAVPAESFSTGPSTSPTCGQTTPGKREDSLS